MARTSPAIAGFFLRVIHTLNMTKSFIASTIAVTLSMIGFAIGCLLWVAIGWGLGSLVHAPISGALTGLAWQYGSFILLKEMMWESLERNHVRFLNLIEA